MIGVVLNPVMSWKVCAETVKVVPPVPVGVSTTMSLLLSGHVVPLHSIA